jgi:hypothetical protein
MSLSNAIQIKLRYPSASLFKKYITYIMRDKTSGICSGLISNEKGMCCISTTNTTKTLILNLVDSFMVNNFKSACEKSIQVYI